MSLLQTVQGDPIITLELLMLVLSLCYLWKITFSKDVSNRASRTATSHIQTDGHTASLEFSTNHYRSIHEPIAVLFEVGSLISLPKRSLKKQAARTIALRARAS
ncbi:MAG: hypothetical protein IT291_07395 [Deltaproteobacteria bacterium]|nr:hypothetical protein [Deltaproteobacteria bacterium]